MGNPNAAAHHCYQELEGYIIVLRSLVLANFEQALGIEWPR